ncbi:MAG TPA: hypothetical protein VGF70_09980 [Solirubrobacteraceae bacterium]|jgi:hypothetical protein
MAKWFTAGILAGLVLWPAAAVASGPSSLYGRVLQTYQTHGSIPPCLFTSPQLASALNSVDTYGQQYYADFIGAIQAAQDARASGSCSKGHHPAVAHATGSAPAGPRLPTSVTASTSSGVPAPLIALGVAAALLAGATGLAVLGRGRAASSDWGHGWAQTRYRVGELWDGLAGRLRR